MRLLGYSFYVLKCEPGDFSFDPQDWQLGIARSYCAWNNCSKLLSSIAMLPARDDGLNHQVKRDGQSDHRKGEWMSSFLIEGKQDVEGMRERQHSAHFVGTWGTCEVLQYLKDAPASELVSVMLQPRAQSSKASRNQRL